MESGLLSFHLSYSEYLSKVRLRVEEGEKDDNEWDPTLRLDQLYFVLVIYGIQIMIAVCAFVIEMMAHRRQSRRINHHDDI